MIPTWRNISLFRAMTMDNFIFKHHCQVKVSLISHRYHTGTTPIQHRYYIGILVETETDTSWRYDTTSIYMTDDNVGKLLTHLRRNSGSFLTKTSFSSSEISSHWLNLIIKLFLGFLTLTGATIGEVSAGEFTGDTTTDVLIPNYTRNEIIILEQDESWVIHLVWLIPLTFKLK